MGNGPRWSDPKLKRDLAIERAILKAWVAGEPAEDISVYEAAVDLAEMQARTSNVSMPREGSSSLHQMSWWTPELTQLRKACMARRRFYKRCRKWRVRDEDEEQRRYSDYRSACEALQVAIKEAKESASKEFPLT